MVFASLLSQHYSYFAKNRVPDRKGLFYLYKHFIVFLGISKKQKLDLDNYGTGDRFDKCKC